MTDPITQQPAEPVVYLRADGPHSEAQGTKCPVTGRPYFMHLTHPELGQVPTYGGPYDSYTAPYAEGEPTDPWHERELAVHRYDHDRGHWVEDESIPVRIIHESVLFELQEKAEKSAAVAPAAIALSDSRAGSVYLAGPMTGYEDWNFPAFNEAAAKLRANGLKVVNPAEHGIVAAAEWGDYLRYDIAKLATCASIALLPGWSKSKGAMLEVHIARALGMTIVEWDGAESATDSAAASADLLAELHLLEEVCAFYANDEDRYNDGSGEAYGGVPVPVGLKARAARRRFLEREAANNGAAKP